jgi:hypothetical protein
LKGRQILLQVPFHVGVIRNSRDQVQQAQIRSRDLAPRSLERRKILFEAFRCSDDRAFHVSNGSRAKNDGYSISFLVKDGNLGTGGFAVAESDAQQIIWV